MKLLALSFLSLVAATFVSGCAGEGGGYHTHSQLAAQHSGYDPTDRTSTSRY